MWKVSFRSSFKKDLKKLTRKNPQLRETILNLAEKIEKNPESGTPLKGGMDTFIKYKFNKSPEMRIIYVLYIKDENGNFPFFTQDEIDDFQEDLNECEGLIEFVWVKTREEMNNIYNKRKSYFENFLR